MKTANFDDLYKVTKNPTLIILLENLMYRFAEKLSEHDELPYSSGTWKSKRFEDGGWFFNLSEERQWRVVNTNNYADVTVGSLAFSLAVFTFALSDFSIYLFEKGIHTDPVVDEIADLHCNAMRLANTVLSEEDYEAFCSIVD